MSTRHLDPNSLARDEDWEGNNAAFTCPNCQKVYIVSGAPMIHDGQRDCPSCGRSTAFVDGGRLGGGSAWIEWPDDD